MFRHLFILIFALVVSAVIWWIGPLIAIGRWFPLASQWPRAILVGLLLFWAVWPWIARCFSWMSGKLFTPFARRAPVSAVSNHRFYDAVSTLRYVGLSEQRTYWRRMCYRLYQPWLRDRPWFLVIGPQDSGKTSLLSESQQTFLLAEQYGLHATTGTGPTQECNWWLTRDAIWIDTPGSWAQSEDSVRADKARTSLLRLLRRKRGFPPIDGIFLCLDAHWLLQASLSEHKALADTLRARLLGCANDARCDLPVYLMLSHLDQLPGGASLLAMMSDNLRRQGIGFSIEAGQKHAEQAFAALLVRISQYVLELIHDVNSETERHQLLQLIESLGTLSRPLFSLINQIFPSSPVGYEVQLRHIWLGSARQIALDPLNVATSWGSSSTTHPTTELWQSGFDHAITERHILTSGGQRSAAVAIRRLVGSVLVLLFLSGAGWGLLRYYQWEKDYIGYVNATFDETRRLVREVPATQRPGENLIAAYEQLGYMNAQLESVDTLPLNPYVEHLALNDAATATWHRHLLKIFWPAVQAYIVDALQQDANTHKDDVYDTLKVYMMLVDPAHRDPVALNNWFMARWDRFAPPGYASNNKTLFGYHLKALFSLAATPALKPDVNLVRLARVRAAEIPQQMRVINRLRESSHALAMPDVTLANAAGSDVMLTLRRKSDATVNDVAVPGFYTRSSYRDVVLPEVENMSKAVLEEESWVMADKDSASNLEMVTATQRLMDETRKLYLLEYANHWADFIKDIRARPVQSIDDAASLARQLADPSSSLANLIRFITRETSLTGRDDAGATSWFDRQRYSLQKQKRDIVDEISGDRSRFKLTPEQAVEDRFQPLRRLGLELAKSNVGNDSLQRTFNELYNLLAAASVRLNSSESNAQSPDDGLKRARIDAARYPDPVRSVMMDLIERGQSQTLAQIRQKLSSNTASLTTGEGKNIIANRYPFSTTAKNEIGINDFSRLFAKDGSLQRFFDQNLASLVDVNQRPWRAKDPSLISAGTVRSFESAAKIRESWLNSSGNMALTFFLTPMTLSSNISEAVLDIDGQVIRYSHGQSQPERVEWPGPKGGTYIRLTFKANDGSLQTAMFEGPWALFRLYDRATVSNMSSDTRELLMMLNGMPGSFAFTIRSAQQNFPLWSRALRNFKCP
ncbi:type VI secretion system membrane subunit TssM [Candidatus Pantoea floridensis]|uniref:Type VI secretion system protein ImpL n=1 Tax=Candidatus Pantoea floridensis TaxID=1938870 RepID=A0A286DLY3_9GAMM|nr:type VI secretion system membrane subunit TssM [Pantoea floridensis]PIF14748.1 type VI secretion system protein ImpL [Enterobacteriaceae bacterium JKS000233]SOD59656.1 type VI secretion system protein ImpL [Pantoea floridensis]